MCPYFTLVGRPQTVNENNDFKKTVMDACVTACNEDSSSVVLNTTTDGVASEVQWNLCVMVGLFLWGSMNYVSLPNTYHNVKNARYQLIGGSSCAVIGSYVLDPWYLKMAGIHQTLWRLEDRWLCFWCCSAVVGICENYPGSSFIHQEECHQIQCWQPCCDSHLASFPTIVCICCECNCPTVERQSINFIYHMYVFLILSMQHDDC